MTKMHEVLRESTAEAAKKKEYLVVKQQVIENRLSAALRPAAAKGGSGNQSSAPASPGVASPIVHISVVRRNQERAEALKIAIPADSELAKHSAAIQAEHRKEMEALAAHVLQMNAAQQAESAEPNRAQHFQRGSRG